MNDQTTQLTQDFSKELISIVPEFQELAQAKRDLETDPASKKLWVEKEELRITIELMKKQGLPVSAEQDSNLSLKLKEMRGNPITMRYLKAINFASKISGKIGAELYELIGADFAPRTGCK